MAVLPISTTTAHWILYRHVAHVHHTSIMSHISYWLWAPIAYVENITSECVCSVLMLFVSVQCRIFAKLLRGFEPNGGDQDQRFLGRK